MCASWVWPWHYNFPPFFTLQPNLQTRKSQLAAWRSLILSYCQSKKVFVLDVNQNDPLFANDSINRQLSQDAIRIVLDDLKQHQRIEWIDKSHNRCLVYWKTPTEWATSIYSWAQQKALMNSVCTLYEIVSGDDSVGYDFHGLHEAILKKALESLEKDGKVAIISFDGNEGVKFL